MRVFSPILAFAEAAAPNWTELVTTFGSPAALVCAVVIVLRILKDFMTETRTAQGLVVAKMVEHLETIGKTSLATAESLKMASDTNLTVMHEGRELIRELADMRRQYDPQAPQPPKPPFSLKPSRS